MSTVNLNRSPFLRYALRYIAANPGCCKYDVAGRNIPNRTRAYRYAALDRLITNELVDSSGSRRNRYSLTVR